MSQQDLGNLGAPMPPEVFFPRLRAWATAVESMHGGDTRPAYVKAGMMWRDTSTTPWVINLFDGVDDVVFGYWTPAAEETPAVFLFALGAENIETAHLKNYAVTEPKLAEGAVSTQKVGDKQITRAKMEDMPPLSLMGNNEGEAGRPKHLTVAEFLGLLDLGSAATQDVGTAAGNVIQLDGDAKLPSVDGSQLTNLDVPPEEWEVLSVVDVSSAVNNVTIELPATHTRYRLRLEEVSVNAATAVRCGFLFSVNGSAFSVTGSQVLMDAAGNSLSTISNSRMEAVGSGDNVRELNATVELQQFTNTMLANLFSRGLSGASQTWFTIYNSARLTTTATRASHIRFGAASGQTPSITAGRFILEGATS